MTTPAPASNTGSTAAPPASVQELFALTDEQILEIEPQSNAAAPAGVPASGSAPSESRLETGTTKENSAEPPAWLARQMNDPWSGEEARELWNGVQQARNEAAAYRASIATPEEARALKDLYPGGVEQARSTAERARALEEIDTAFFGGAGKSAQEVSAGRAALAERMLRQDPAAFREMVFSGLRALEAAGASSAAASDHVALRFSGASSQSAETPSDVRLKPDATHQANNAARSDAGAAAQIAAYRSFEKTANDELERSVGTAIGRSLEHALPNLSRMDGATGATAQGASLQTRLQQAVRDDVEAALKSDQQLGEQLGRLLAARRFDETTRSQVVRLINDRAQQLVPVATRRVIQEWTQTALATQRGNGFNVAPGFRGFGGPVMPDSPASGNDAILAGPDPNSAQPRSLANSFGASRQSRQAGTSDSSRSATRTWAPATSAKAAAANRAERDAGLAPRTTPRPNGRAVDYNRLSDEQILDM